MFSFELAAGSTEDFKLKAQRFLDGLSPFGVRYVSGGIKASPCRFVSAMRSIAVRRPMRRMTSSLRLI